jgi:hypothetical protein
VTQSKSQPGLPDGLFQNQKLGKLENDDSILWPFGIFYGHLGFS